MLRSKLCSVSHAVGVWVCPPFGGLCFFGSLVLEGFEGGLSVLISHFSKETSPPARWKHSDVNFFFQIQGTLMRDVSD